MSDSGSTPPADSAKPSSPSSTSLAFLVHSPDTVQRNLPPDVDNKPLARQKRRRTSPEDQKILEAEYERNSKPDKAQRQKIVERVALGEKEVQIWFQNRRQNARRKSRPLEPHEIRSRLEASSQELGPDMMFSSSSILHSDDTEEGEQTQVYEDIAETIQEEPKNESELSTQPKPALLLGIESATEGDISLQSDQDATNGDSQKSTATTESQPTEETQTTATVLTELSNSQPLPSSQPWPSSQESQRQGIGYLANRRSASFVRNYEEPAPEKPTQATTSSQEQAQPRTLRKTQSFVRLSMTEDGKARVISADDSPSPPRSQPTPTTVIERSGGFRRSYSGTALNDRFRQAQSPQTPMGLTRSSSGRSRDSRAWEFWCDSDARNSLAQKANQEGSGSAADAIGLIRATSRSILKPNPNKRNAQLLPQSTAKRQKTDGKSSTRPPLSRSVSSMDRLQGRTAGTSRSPIKKSQSAKIPKTTDGDGFEVLQTESDKENWEPHVQGGSVRRRQPTTHGQQRRRVLGENTNILSTNSSLGSMMDREKALKPSSNRRPPNPEDDEEIAAFMGSTRETSQRTSVSSGEELGCVQGLLKLSQGNWR